MKEYKEIVEIRKALYQLVKMRALQGKRSMRKRLMIKRSMRRRLGTLQETRTGHGSWQRKKPDTHLYHLLIKFATKMEKYKTTEAMLRGPANYKHMRVVATKPKIPMRYIYRIY